jgi:RloB-like protein
MDKPMRQSFMIYCEGQTEVGYFNSFKKRAKSLNGGNALAIVKEAVKQKNAAAKPVDQYWVVFDKDETTDADFNAAILLATENNILPAWSNQAFELWFILHYQPHTVACNRNAYEAILRRYIASYTAGAKSEEQGKQLYSTTISLILIALTNAKAGYDSFVAPALTEAQKESSTIVYKLVTEILANS